MVKKRTTVVDFIAKGAMLDEWKMVLVEAGPWTGDTETQLRRVQKRLYGCVDAALGGQLVEKFPESNGKKIVVQLDCYNLPKPEVTAFFDKFSHGIFSTPDYRRALEDSQFVKGMSFEANFGSTD